MPRLIRWHESEFVHFVTNRTEHEMLFLLPTQKINELILFWLAKAKEKKGKAIQLYSFIFMSNHYHMLLQDPEGELADFIGYFQGNLAKAINKELKRKGRFWSREYDDVIVDGEEEFLNRIAYIAANPVKAGLVTKPDMWKGISSIPYETTDRAIVGNGLDVTAYNNARRHGRKADKKKFEETYIFAISTPPMVNSKTAKQRFDYLKKLISEAGINARKQRGAKPSLGMKKVLQQSPFHRPASPARGARFKIMSFCKDRKKELENAYKLFVSFYRECCQQLIAYFKEAPIMQGLSVNERESAFVKYCRKAPTIIWPSGCYVPTTHKPVGA
ncbi:MAG: transposase [Deltaproteobacteria bacterium]|nr:transposase [Deltaproteobacteria bacterium]MBN2672905.1 transposase [Deltaproteobacteria bacterium]